MEPSQEVTVDVALKPNDVYHPFLWSRFNLVRWVVALAFILVVADKFFSPDSTLDSFPDAGSLKAVIVALSSLIVLGLVLFPYLRVRSEFSKTPTLSEPCRITISRDGVKWVRKNANADCQWSVFTKVLETRQSFVFYTTQHAGQYIPKRFFSDPNQILSVRQLIKDNFKGKWRLRRD